MGARSGSLGWVVLAGSVSIGVASAMWGLFNSVFIAELTSTTPWATNPGTIPAMGRGYILTAWDWMLLIVLLRVGIEAIVAARLSGATSLLPVATVLLLISHLMAVLFALVFPEMAQPLYDMALNDYSTALAALPGTKTAVKVGYEWGIGVLPAVLLVVADGWYLSAPIRNDMLGRRA